LGVTDGPDWLRSGTLLHHLVQFLSYFGSGAAGQTAIAGPSPRGACDGAGQFFRRDRFVKDRASSLPPYMIYDKIRPVITLTLNILDFSLLRQTS
jgi:hypothetical protein